MGAERTSPISADNAEDRYGRLSLIPWWNQQRLASARILVVGAGALGNEIIKNLALLGAGNILIVDFDRIEISNLSRSVLYRASDDSKSKAHTAAAAARQINPDCRVHALNADITSGVGLGLFRWADVVIGGLDNREARLAVNRACWKVNRPWVDGATESFQGIARVFVPPDGVCYECTLTDQDRRLMAARNSCGFLAKAALNAGGTPTTPATSAVVAGIEVQEAVKLLHPDCGLPGLANRGFFFDGLSYDCFTIAYERREDCLSHETFQNIVETGLSSDTATPADVLREAAAHIGDGVVIDLPGEMITGLRCPDCEAVESFCRLLSTVRADEAACPQCGRERVPEVETECSADSAYAGVPLAELGFGVMEILPCRRGDLEVQIEISGDACSVLRGEH